MQRLTMKHFVYAALSCAWLPFANAHDHFAAGVTDTNQNGQPDAGEPLRVIGPAFEQKVFHLLPRPFGFRPIQRAGGHYTLDENARSLFPLDAFSFTVLSSGIEQEAEQGHPHTGAYIWVEIVSVKGPDGGNFGYWENGRSAAYDTPSVVMAANEPVDGVSFVISGGYDGSDQDPHGHFHGRAWTADKAGDYYVTYRFVDRSTSGPGGGPWHTPSEPFTFHYKAGPDFQPVGKHVEGQGFVLTWKSGMGIWAEATIPQTGVVFNVMRSSTMEADDWEKIGSVTGTIADEVSFTDSEPPEGKAFYRLEYTWAPQE